MEKPPSLPSAEALERLKKFGPNIIAEKKPPGVLSLLLTQLKSPLIYVLIFASVITLALKELTDTVMILTAVGINTILGFLQEYKAQQSLLALKKLLTLRSRVVRDGKVHEVSAQSIVTGDLVVLATGDKIPADGTVVESSGMMVN